MRARHQRTSATIRMIAAIGIHNTMEVAVSLNFCVCAAARGEGLRVGAREERPEGARVGKAVTEAEGGATVGRGGVGGGEEVGAAVGGPPGDGLGVGRGLGEGGGDVGGSGSHFRPDTRPGFSVAGILPVFR